MAKPSRRVRNADAPSGDETSAHAPSETAVRYAGPAQSTTNVRNRTKLLPHRLVQNELWLARVHFKVLDRGLELARRSPVLGITIARSTYRHLLVLESDKSLHASGSVTRGSALVGC